MSSSAEPAGRAASTSRPGSAALAGTRDERRVLALSRRERFLVAALVLVTIIALAGGYLAVRGLLSSPEQRAAHAAPLEELTVTVPVQRESRQEAVTLQATITYPDSLPVPPPTAEEGPAILVQMELAPSDTLAGGDLIADISGQPLIALPGAFPLYRDLTRGDSGKDVTAVQAALDDLGYLHGAVDGVFGPDTEQAVLALLEDRGYPATTVQSTVPVKPPPAAGDATGGDDGAAASGGAADEPGPATPEPTDAPEPRTRTVTTVPRTLFAMIDTLPSTVLTVPAQVGDDLAAAETLLTLSPSEPVVRGSIATTQALDITEGMPVLLTVDGRERSGTVRSIVESGEDDGLSHLTVMPEEPLDADLVGTGTTLTVVTSSTEGEVLTVPVGAIRSDARASTYVLVPGEDAARRIPVEVVGTVDGGAVLAEDTDLVPGDEVLLGGESVTGEGE